MKKGFTLIELLAVIVILAIIALIATPIVINIISDTKKSAGLRSADFYLDAVEFSIANRRLNNKPVTNGTYTIMENGNICMGTFTNNTCTDEMKVEIDGEVPTLGTITLTNGKIDNIDIVLDNKKIVKNYKGEIIYKTSLTDACKLESSTALTVGAKYSCDFGEGTRNFYILELGTDPVTDSTLESNEVALILEGNYDTTKQPWCDPNGLYPEDTRCQADGLKEKLDEIASSWTKLDRKQVGLPSAAQIYKADGQGELNGLNDFTISSSNAWLHSNGQAYWTSTEREPESVSAYGVLISEYVDFRNSVLSNDIFGVRPVITLGI